LAQARHCEVVVSHTGRAPEQSALLTHPTHTCEAVSHTDVGALQSLLLKHCTHRFAVASHLGAAGLVQSPSRTQTAHEPAFIPLVTQAGPPRLPTQSELVTHAWQVLFAPQVGLLPLQSELRKHWVQVPVGKSQTDLFPVHWLLWADEHWPQAPHTSQAGVVPPQSASEPHGLQLPLLQIGVVPPQSAAERHWTHVLVTGEQRGAWGVQLTSLRQATQVPALGAMVSQ
jgi:hypothetical protein